MRTMMLVLALLVLGVTARGQTVNSDGVSVRNSAPANVFFIFPVGDSNVVEIQMGCSDSAANRNYVFVYEETPTGIVTYPFQTTVTCNESYGSNYTTYSATLADPTTVTTPDHKITIDGAAWTAVKGSRAAWHATGGSCTLTIN